ncbi:TetR/AcrR family transcriptional regulator [Asanoa sp. WMMD1127]|uniref:TetR/AcrR family transcriptional regulator n=1 Tax=Asanoa sp. WMMD1127 TaxID=3016107 RepID=UPI002416E79B|nr:TetR/AcrR family transcriptional regulator [Asanoa sp. WMMD1127]MDG4820854.1 TetR/AcrR family transcriptional regulator [Asanoa sp. WMMD1127]
MTTAAARPRRADAERNIARIVAAARATLSRNPDATVDDVAKAAGVGRMTVYGHFRTRPELVEAALVEALRAGEETLSAVELGGDARAALGRLLTSTWSLVAESSALVTAAEGVLPQGRLRELHAGPAKRVEQLIKRGQRQGVFRTDLPVGWLVSSAHYLVKGAAAEIHAGRLEPADAPRLVTESVQSLLAAR